MCRIFNILIGAVLSLGFFGASSQIARAQDDAALPDIRADSAKLMAAFNAGKVADIAAMFIAKGELIDEQGTVYQGQEEIAELLTAFFTKFPGAQMAKEVDSLRMVGPVAIEEGTRITTTKDGNASRIRYVSVLAKTDKGWRIASIRDFPDETMPTSGELLQPLDWLIGNWVNEGADARVSIQYRWSEDKNFILGDISVTKDNQVVMKSSQRIGWDPIVRKPRSWLFDSDGGFAEGSWTLVDNNWHVRSTAVLPDGQTGSATLTIKPGENARFVIAGTDRLVGDTMEADYEITVVKEPPTPGK